MDQEFLQFLMYLIRRAEMNMEQGDGQALRMNLLNLRRIVDAEIKIDYLDQ